MWIYIQATNLQNFTEIHLAYCLSENVAKSVGGGYFLLTHTVVYGSVVCFTAKQPGSMLHVLGYISQLTHFTKQTIQRHALTAQCDFDNVFASAFCRLQQIFLLRDKGAESLTV